jgi:hypothetical protein
MPKREAFFECVFVSERNEYQFHFRAWNEVEAEAHFRETLSAYGLTSPGSLVIRNARGQVVRRAEYRPLAAAHASR